MVEVPTSVSIVGSPVLVSAAPVPDPLEQRVDAAFVHALIARGEHLGPVAELRKRLGAPDMTQDDGARLWYGDYLFIVEKDYVISAHNRNRKATQR